MRTIIYEGIEKENLVTLPCKSIALVESIVATRNPENLIIFDYFHYR